MSGTRKGRRRRRASHDFSGVIRLMLWLVPTLLFAGILYCGLGKIGAEKITTDEYFSDYRKFILLLSPALLSLVISLIQNRLLWIWSVIFLNVMLALAELASIGTQSVWYVIYVIICYILVLVAIFMGYGNRFDLSSISNSGSDSSSNYDPCGGMCN